MEKFILKKSKEANTPITIRFPDDMYIQIKSIVQDLNQNLKTKAYSYNGFVVSACEYALKKLNIKDNEQQK